MQCRARLSVRRGKDRNQLGFGGSFFVWVNFGTSDAPAEPRPDSDGFSIKKRWQLNSKVPSSTGGRLKLPSGAITQLWVTSARFAAMIWDTICALTVPFVISTNVSTRRFKLRLIQSAEDMNTFAFLWGRPSPLPKQTIHLHEQWTRQASLEK